MASHSTITISIKDQSNDIVYLRVGRDVNIKKVLQTYCQGKQVEYGTLNFFLHGNRLPRTGTVAQVGLVDGDEIDALGYAHGGGPSN